MYGSVVNLGSPVNWSHPLNRGRVLWLYGLPQWSGGSRWFDLAGQNTGTLTNGPTWRATGSGDVGLNLDGSDDYVNCGSSSLFNFTSGDFTIAYWVRSTSPASSHCPLSRGIFNTDGWYTQIANQLRFVTNGPTASNIGGSTNLTASVWYRAHFTRTGGTSYIYLNGKLDGSGASNTPVTASRNLDVGRYSGAAFFLSGQLADVGIWNRALSADDVRADYDLSRRGYPDVLQRLRQQTWFAGAGGGGGSFQPAWAYRNTVVVGGAA